MPPRRRDGDDSDEENDELAALRAARSGGAAKPSLSGPPEDEDPFLPSAPRSQKGPQRPPPGYQASAQSEGTGETGAVRASFAAWLHPSLLISTTLSLGHGHSLPLHSSLSLTLYIHIHTLVPAKSTSFLLNAGRCAPNVPHVVWSRKVGQQHTGCKR